MLKVAQEKFPRLGWMIFLDDLEMMRQAEASSSYASVANKLVVESDGEVNVMMNFIAPKRVSNKKNGRQAGSAKVEKKKVIPRKRTATNGKVSTKGINLQAILVLLTPDLIAALQTILQVLAPILNILGVGSLSKKL